MSFNPAPSKQAQKVIFSKDSRHPLISKNFIGYEAMSQKHLGITLDNPLSFGEHLRLVFGKTDGTWVCYANFNISSQDPHFLLCIKLLSDLILIMVTLYMNKLTINPFSRKQNLSNITHVYTGALSSTSEEKLYDELGLDTLQLCRWFRKLYYFYNFYKNKPPQYLSKLVSLRHSPYTTRKTENIPFSKQNIAFSNIRFFFQLPLSGTVLTIAVEISDALVLLKSISNINLSGQPHQFI